MGVARLRRQLARHQRIALDTSTFIYHLEANPRYTHLTDEAFRSVEAASHSAVTSTLTLTEVLVHPYRNEDEDQAQHMYALLTSYPNLAWIPAHLEVADLAARIRAKHRLRTPDAIHAATAIYAGATALITNDEAFKRVGQFDVLLLDEFV